MVENDPLILVLVAHGAPALRLIVKNLADGAKKWAEYRDRYDLGASAMKQSCGFIRQGGKLVARVSYNGRLWDAAGQSISTQTL